MCGSIHTFQRPADSMAFWNRGILGDQHSAALQCLPRTDHASRRQSRCESPRIDEMGPRSILVERAKEPRHQCPYRRHSQQAFVPQTDSVQPLPDSRYWFLRMEERACREDAVPHSSQGRRIICLRWSIRHMETTGWSRIENLRNRDNRAK